MFIERISLFCVIVIGLGCTTEVPGPQCTEDADCDSICELIGDRRWCVSSCDPVMESPAFDRCREGYVCRVRADVDSPRGRCVTGEPATGGRRADCESTADCSSGFTCTSDRGCLRICRDTCPFSETCTMTGALPAGLGICR